MEVNGLEKLEKYLCEHGFNAKIKHAEMSHDILRVYDDDGNKLWYAHEDRSSNSRTACEEDNCKTFIVSGFIGGNAVDIQGTCDEVIAFLERAAQIGSLEAYREWQFAGVDDVFIEMFGQGGALSIYHRMGKTFDACVAEDPDKYISSDNAKENKRNLIVNLICQQYGQYAGVDDIFVEMFGQQGALPIYHCLRKTFNSCVAEDPDKYISSDNAKENKRSLIENLICQEYDLDSIWYE